uniref:Uncharacterized protein n=1 Tax=Bawangfen virus TaxID=2656651 RepID=A0A5P8PP33_9VIRU|nr:MAG: hypothetical protein [Bawangfen virus]
MSKSAVPIQHGFPNPMFERVFGLIQQQQELKALVSEVKTCARSNKSFGDLCQSLRGGLFEERLRRVWEEMHQGKTEPVLGPPPRPCEVYGRFGVGVSVLDFGSGNCSKLSLFSGDLKFSVCDLKPVNTKLVVKILDGPLENHLTNEAKFFTSFMFLSQATPSLAEGILNRDGIHLVPELSWLRREGVATPAGEDLWAVKTLKQTFFDREVNQPGLSLKNGYKLVVGFSAVDVEVNLGSEVSKGPAPDIDATPAGLEDINYEDVTYKYDGVPFELELHQGQAYLVNRAGEQFLGETNFKEHVCLHLERLSEEFVLIRIVEYRGMIPPHCGEVLRYFCSRVKMKINGLPVVGPECWDPHKRPSFPYDGLISRVGERDHYHKAVWTLDLYPEGLPRLRRALEDKGFRLDVDDPPGEGLWEFAMHRDGAVVALQTVRRRFDKIKPTSPETALYLLDKKTLAEHEALTGYKWNN